MRQVIQERSVHLDIAEKAFNSWAWFFGPVLFRGGIT